MLRIPDPGRLLLPICYLYRVAHPGRPVQYSIPCVTISGMRLSKSLLLYQDEPAYGLPLKLIFLVVPGLLLAASIVLRAVGEVTGSLVLLIEAFTIGLIFWAVFPRKYQVYEDHLRIALGGPFSVRIGFDSIKTVSVTNSFSLTVNLTTTLARSYVKIEKKRGFDVAITPRDRDLFVENANRALNQWIKRNSRG
jgi:hypothetical protein